MWWRKIEVDAPAAAAWAVLVDLDRWPQWGPSVTDARLDDGDRWLGPESRGAVRTPVGAWVPFRVTQWDEGRVWGWRVAGIPATVHRVEPAGRDRCRVSIGVPTWSPAYLLVVAIALPRIADLAVAADRPTPPMGSRGGPGSAAPGRS